MGIDIRCLYSKFQNSELKGVVCSQESIKSPHFLYLAHRDISGNRMLRNLKIPPFTESKDSSIYSFHSSCGAYAPQRDERRPDECGRASGETEESLDPMCPMSPMLYFALNSQKSAKMTKIDQNLKKIFLVKVEARPHFST